jgi:hypothetical protein
MPNYAQSVEYKLISNLDATVTLVLKGHQTKDHEFVVADLFKSATFVAFELANPTAQIKFVQGGSYMLSEILAYANLAITDFDVYKDGVKILEN